MTNAEENEMIRRGLGTFVKSAYDHAAESFGKTPSAAHFAALEEAMWALQGSRGGSEPDMVLLRQVWTGSARNIVPTLAAAHKSKAG